MLAFFTAWTALTAMNTAPPPETVRIAVFNIWELSAVKINQVDERGQGTHPQLRNAAEIVRRVRPDVLLINEIDYDEKGENAARFQQRYLAVSQNKQPPIIYPHVFVAPVNTGLPSGHDLDNDGSATGPGDALGYGRYPGQYGMALLSRFPLDAAQARTFQTLLWKDVPGNLMPDGTANKPEWYAPDEVAILRLSSKSHWDVPVKIGDTVVHVLAAHPTPPVFDGPENRNGRRAHDEIRLWADYLTGGKAAEYIVDDRGRRGGSPADTRFVILGDLNADPVKGERVEGRAPIELLLKHPRVQDPQPRSEGSLAGAKDYPGDKSIRTCDFGRLDYVLPCRELKVKKAGVFWPKPSDPLHRLVATRDSSSDHRLVWIDVELRSEN
jgi:endonuclease/exonuclease/phosphatase family metal-dependent hydrolase